jgi:hypothetical protein
MTSGCVCVSVRDSTVCGWRCVTSVAVAIRKLKDIIIVPRLIWSSSTCSCGAITVVFVPVVLGLRHPVFENFPRNHASFVESVKSKNALQSCLIPSMMGCNLVRTKFPLPAALVLNAQVMAGNKRNSDETTGVSSFTVCSVFDVVID